MITIYIRSIPVGFTVGVFDATGVKLRGPGGTHGSHDRARAQATGIAGRHLAMGNAVRIVDEVGGVVTAVKPPTPIPPPPPLEERIEARPLTWRAVTGWCVRCRAEEMASGAAGPAEGACDDAPFPVRVDAREGLGAPGWEAEWRRPEGLFRERECRCAAHGGAAEARDQVERRAETSWFRLAPDGVEHVVEAGSSWLGTECYDVVIRPATAGGGFTVSLGLGSHAEGLRGRWATLDEARAAGAQAWQRLLATRLTALANKRGGTLDWGVVYPIPQGPRFRYPKQGQSAWDAPAEPGEQVKP